MDQAGIFPEHHILDVVQAVLDLPIAAFEGQESLRRPVLRREAGDPLVDHPLGGATLGPGRASPGRPVPP
jgi:hypothetical protein